MREIKFRAWDKRQEIMIPNDQIMRLEFGKNGVDWLGCWVVVADSEGNPEQGLHQVAGGDLELMQYTGLKDKNGKEIYENDYLGDYCVFWGGGKYILQNISTGDIIDCNETNTQNKEVTGNRYENPREHKAMETDL